jgi:hypothetical protein
MRHCLTAIGVISLLLGAGCETTKECSLVGCQNSFTATVRSADGSFPSGAHRVQVLSDSSTLNCAFTFPTGAGTAQPVCDGGMTVAVWPETTCTDTMATGTASHSCDPIPGKFVETITVVGTPGQVHAWQYVDDAPILDVAAAPTYQISMPNGPGCGPSCLQATASWTLTLN